ncbi:protein of unknown function [Serratia sp. Tan611]|nr:protein of unknown function [Serratia sp. Tan611]
MPHAAKRRVHSLMTKYLGYNSEKICFFIMLPGAVAAGRQGAGVYLPDFRRRLYSPGRLDNAR